MKYFVMVLLSAISVNTTAQKIVKNELDEFTHLRIIETNYSTIYNNLRYSMYVNAQRVDTSYYIHIGLSKSDEPLTVNQGDALMLKLEDGKVVNLYAENFITSDKGGQKTGNFIFDARCGVNITYKIDKTTFENLTHAKVMKFRCYTSNTYFEKDLNTNAQSRIQKALLLVKE